MKKEKIKLIIFDAYGPILSRGYPDTISELCRRYRVKQSKERLFEVIYRKYFNMAAEKKITQKEAWVRPVKELSLPLKWQDLRKLHYDLFTVNRPVLALAKKLRKKYKTLLLSKNTRSQFADCKRMFPEVWKSFDRVINTWELGLPKASKETILEVSKRFKISPREMLFIDDQQANLVAPKQMGMATIFYQNLKQFKKDFNKFNL